MGDSQKPFLLSLLSLSCLGLRTQRYAGRESSFTACPNAETVKASG